MKKDHTALLTGHRKIDVADLSPLSKLLDLVIERLIIQGVIFWGCGGGLGFDQLAGFAVIKLREKYPAVRLIMVLPCHGQDIYWHDKEKEDYYRLLAVADKIVYVSEYFDKDCMARRNLHLVEHSRFCVAYMKHGMSGTSQTVRMSRERGLTIINLADLL